MEIKLFILFIDQECFCVEINVYMSDLEEILGYRMVQMWEKDKCGGNLCEVLWYFFC